MGLTSPCRRAQQEGFEPSHLAGLAVFKTAPLQPLGYCCIWKHRITMLLLFKLLGEQFQSRASPVGFHILQFGFCCQEVGPSSVPLCGTIFSSRLLRMLSPSEKFICRLHQEHSSVLVYQQLFNTFLFLSRTNHSLHLSCNDSAYL